MKNEMLESLVARTENDNEEWKKLERGVQRAVRAYYNSRGGKYLIVDDMWEEDTEGFVSCLRMCGIKEIIFAETSTEATKCLRVMIKMGCKITGVQVYKEVDWITKVEKYEGIVIEL